MSNRYLLIGKKCNDSFIFCAVIRKVSVMGTNDNPLLIQTGGPTKRLSQRKVYA